MPEEINRFEVFPAAVDIRHPLALLAAVVAIQHGSHRIDAQAIDVEMLQPMDAAGDEESLHFPPPEIVDVGVPVLMKSLLGIGMFEQRRTVEAGEPMCVGREMRRYPIDDHPDA